MIIKQTVFKIENLEIIDSSMTKVAGVGIPADETYDPDFLYLRVRAVSAGEYYGDNKNGDWFPEAELKNSYTTFLTGHVFKNHENKDPAKAIGEVLDAEWDDSMKCVCLVIKIDRKIAPSIVRAIEKGYMTDVSMGCRVPYSICSICGNKARNPKEYCDHIKFLRRKILPDGKKVFEINIQPKFHDISIVLSGAEKVAKITDIYDENSAKTGKKADFAEKVASYSEACMEKTASFENKIHDAINDAFELPHYDKLERKTAAEKTAALEKKIQGAIVGEARNGIAKDTEISRQILKSIFTPYWNDETLKKMNLKLKALAVQNGKPLPVVFHEFLKALDFAGIELSPKEFTKLSDGIFKESLSFNPINSNPLRALQESESAFGKIDTEKSGLSLEKMLNAATGLSESMPVKKIRIIIRRVSPIEKCDDIQPIIMKNIVGPQIPLRSVHPEPLIKRIRIIKAHPAKGEFGFSSPLGNMLYSLYQNDRVDRMLNGETALGMRKFASYFESEKSLGDGIEKTAGLLGKGYNHYKAAVYGTPLIYGYSKLQQARIKNKAEQGEDNVNPVNRMIAEYPEAVAGLNLLFGPKVYKEIKNTAKRLKKSGAIDNIKDKAKHISFSKKASVFEPAARMYSEGNDESAERLLNKCGFTEQDFAYDIAEKIAACEAEQRAEVEKLANDMRNDNFSLNNTDDFETVMGISEIIRKNLKNLY